MTPLTIAIFLSLTLVDGRVNLVISPQGRKYFLLNDTRDYRTAKSTCSLYTSSLPKFDDPSEQDWTFFTLTQGRPFWIRAESLHLDGSVLGWSDGTDFAYNLLPESGNRSTKSMAVYVTADGNDTNSRWLLAPQTGFKGVHIVCMRDNTIGELKSKIKSIRSNINISNGFLVDLNDKVAILEETFNRRLNRDKLDMIKLIDAERVLQAQEQQHGDDDDYDAAIISLSVALALMALFLIGLLIYIKQLASRISDLQFFYGESYRMLPPTRL
ncbi:hypothetical protein HDE_09111 [Halotydeus destructor]|nr:hypothetical protein HDE_09111 [Halotydeus destructor]